MSDGQWKQIISSPPGWRAVFCAVDGEEVDFYTWAVLAWGLTGDGESVPPIVFDEIDRSVMAVRDSCCCNVVVRILSPEVEITDKLKMELERLARAKVNNV